MYHYNSKINKNNKIDNKNSFFLNLLSNFFLIYYYMSYYNKYLKYKSKYLNLQYGGMESANKPLEEDVTEIKYPDGGIYVGFLLNGKRHGFGKLTFKSSGNVYEGNFENGKRHVQGKFTFKSSGNVYEGNYVNGKRHGQGIFKYQNGDIYEGNFENEKMHGKGKLTFKSEDVYDGNFENDKMHGFCKYTFKNGDKYVGNFENGDMHGDGKYIYSDGIIYDGCFINNFVDIPITQPTEQKEPYEITLFISAHGCEIECKPLPIPSNINFNDYISSTEFECTNSVIPNMDIAYAIALFNTKQNPNELYRQKKRGKNTNTIREFDHKFLFGLKVTEKEPNNYNIFDGIFVIKNTVGLPNNINLFDFTKKKNINE